MQTMVFPCEKVQPGDVCSRVRYYMLEGGKQQAVESLQWFENSPRILDGNCYHFEAHASLALGIAESQDPELEGSRLRRQRWQLPHSWQ